MIPILKKIIAAHPGIYKYLSKQYRAVFKWWMPPQKNIEEIIRLFADNEKEVFFVQVGSNDGISNDPLHHFIIKHEWKGVLVEPVVFLFNRLKNNYAAASSRLHFENAAMSHQDGVATFYYLKETPAGTAPHWYSQIGSFSKEVLLRHKDSATFEDLIVEERVTTISFTSLLNKYKVQEVKLLHIDTEGYDYEVLRMIDWTTLRPQLVIYEYVHLPLHQFIYSLQLMKTHGYTMYSSGLDIVCVQANCASTLFSQSSN